MEATEDFLPRRLLVMMQPLASTPSYCNIVFYLVPVLIVFLSDTELLYNLVSLHLLEEDICQQTVASLGIVLMVSRYPDFTCFNLKYAVWHWIDCGLHLGHSMIVVDFFSQVFRYHTHTWSQKPWQPSNLVILHPEPFPSPDNGASCGAARTLTRFA